MTTDDAGDGAGSGVTARWASGQYADRVRAFVTDAVGEPSALHEVRRRPWSTVWRAETDEGVFYAKENCPGQAAEVATLTTIAAAVPGRTVPVVATGTTTDNTGDTTGEIHDGSGLFLTADHGPTLARARRGEVTTADWCRLVTDAAALARDLLPVREALALTELDPPAAADYVVTLAHELALLPEGDPCRLDATDRHRIEVGLAGLAADVAQVGALGMPLVFDHNDLHADNVFAAPGPTGRLVFFDVGDAVTAHPLAALRVPLASVAEDGSAAAGLLADRPWLGPQAGPLIGAWCEVWGDLVDRAAVEAALPAALRLAALNRVESWRRCLATASAPERATYGEAVPRWLVRAVG